MPELPEVQAHAERLTAAYAGTVLERFVPLRFTALKTATPAPDGGVVTRAALADVMRRRGELDEAAAVLAVLPPIERPEVWLVRGRLAEKQGRAAEAASRKASTLREKSMLS